MILLFLLLLMMSFLNLDIRSLLASENGVVYDVKGVLPRKIVDARL